MKPSFPDSLPEGWRLPKWWENPPVEAATQVTTQTPQLPQELRLRTGASWQPVSEQMAQTDSLLPTGPVPPSQTIPVRPCARTAAPAVRTRDRSQASCRGSTPD